MNTPFKLWLKETLYGLIFALLLLTLIPTIFLVGALNFGSNILISGALKLGLFFGAYILLSAVAQPFRSGRYLAFQKRKSWCSRCKVFGALDTSTTSTHQEDYTHHWTEQVSNGGRYGNDGPQTDSVSRSEVRTREVETTHFNFSCRTCGTKWQVDC